MGALLERERSLKDSAAATTYLKSLAVGVESRTSNAIPAIVEWAQVRAFLGMRESEWMEGSTT